MKTLGLFRCGFIAILLGRFAPGMLAQDKQELPPQLNQGSSISEIVDWLDKNSFSQARIGLEFKGSESYADSTDAMQSIALSTSRLSERLIFSPGFRLLEAQGCRLTLKNDQVRILKAWTGSYDTYQMSFAKFLYEGRKGEKKLTPQSAVLSIPLNKISYAGGKKPYQLTKSPEDAKLLGTWRTEFKEKGFFRRSVFEIQLAAAEGADLTGKMNAGTLTFTFDDKDESERFDRAFRQAVKLCAK